MFDLAEACVGCDPNDYETLRQTVIDNYGAAYELLAHLIKRRVVNNKNDDTPESKQAMSNSRDPSLTFRQQRTRP